MRRIWNSRGLPVGLLLVGIAGLRLTLGYLFGGTSDQAGYMQVWTLIENHKNLYADSSILVWPPYWWIAVGLWSALWRFLASLAPSIMFALGKSFFLKVLYYIFEIALAFLIAWYVGQERARIGAESATRTPRLRTAGLFLLLPATWVITSLHGNFDVMPTFFATLAFLLLEYESSETAAVLASLSIGLAAMARTFPGILAVPALVYVFRRFRWRTGLVCAALCVAPSFLSIYPVYLMTPDAVVRALGYRGIAGGWWGLAGLARLLVSDSLSDVALRVSYPAFYLVLVSLVAGLSWALWKRRLGILEAGMVLSIALFALAPTISNQNFYFLVPWAFWSAVVQKQRAARVFLWFVCVDLALIYVVIPLDLDHPIWFQWTYDFAGAGHVRPLASPSWLVSSLGWFARVFKRSELDYNPFIQLVLRMPVWSVLLWWLYAAVRRSVLHVRQSAGNDANKDDGAGISSATKAVGFVAQVSSGAESGA